MNSLNNDAMTNWRKHMKANSKGIVALDFPLIYNYVQKIFVDQVKQTENLYYGYIYTCHYCNNTYEVMYENGEWEELSIEDTLLIHCKDIKNIPPNSANMCFKYCLRNYRHLNPTLTWNGRFIRQISLPLFDEIDRTDVECTLQFNLSLCNRFVKKNFGEGTFFGYVVSYNNPYYQIVYEDNDAEDLLKGETLMIIFDGIIPRSSVLQIMKNAVSEMEHPRMLNAVAV